jgi:hypothetical protein
MICGVKWKSCECPWFNYEAVEQDRLEHMRIPGNARMDRERMPASSRDIRAAPPSSGHGIRPRPQTYEEEISMRRRQEQRDAEIARRLQFDDMDDDYPGRYGDVIGIGNAAGHFMNDDYRRGSQSHAVHPAPPPPMPASFERATTGDYVSGVNRARGVRGGSMERRLADRFSETRQGSSPATMLPFSPPVPPAPPAPMVAGPPLPSSPGGPMLRRHTMEDEVYNGSPHARLAERLTPRRIRTEYETERAMPGLSSRRRPREPEPKDSVLAGLTGPGSGMNRVFEWRNYVAPGPGPELDGITTV